MPPQVAEETFATFQTTSEFYREVSYRQEFERYCQWYYMKAEHHRQDLKKMRKETNFLSWFRGSHRLR